MSHSSSSSISSRTEASSIPSVSSVSSAPPPQVAVIRNKIIVFDFDDTLFPTNILRSLKSRYMDSNELKAQFQEIDKLICRYVESSLKHTEWVYIVTNSDPGWVHLIAERYLPEFQKLIYDASKPFFIVHTSEINKFYISKFVGPHGLLENLLHSKVNSFLHLIDKTAKILKERYYAGKNIQYEHTQTHPRKVIECLVGLDFICIGDSEVEKFAFKQTVNQRQMFIFSSRSITVKHSNDLNSFYQHSLDLYNSLFG